MVRSKTFVIHNVDITLSDNMDLILYLFYQPELQLSGKDVIIFRNYFVMSIVTLNSSMVELLQCLVNMLTKSKEKKNIKIKLIA